MKKGKILFGSILLVLALTVWAWNASNNVLVDTEDTIDKSPIRLVYSYSAEVEPIKKTEYQTSIEIVDYMNSISKECNIPLPKTKLFIANSTEDFILIAPYAIHIMRDDILALVSPNDTLIIRTGSATNITVISHEMAHMALFNLGYSRTGQEALPEFWLWEKCLKESHEYKMNKCKGTEVCK